MTRIRENLKRYELRVRYNRRKYAKDFDDLSSAMRAADQAAKNKDHRSEVYDWAVKRIVYKAGGAESVAESR